MKNKVFVALSGGVDSAVSAALLQEHGYNVTGVFIKIWQPEFLECTWKEDRLDALRVAAALGIPFKEIDLSGVYKKEVINDMLKGYKSGITPNPDVLCNKYIKFGALWDWAKKNGADFLATGHHARVEKIDDGYKLLRGKDPNKDQSYFLWQLTQDDLAHTIMPVGEMKKEKVRTLAKRFNLPVAKKPDSQGLCFVGHINMHDFLSELLKTKKGKVLSLNGEVIGEHDGAELYTFGQRHGFKISKKTDSRSAQYVTDVNVKKNTITVAPKCDIKKSNAVIIKETNWIIDKPNAQNTFKCQVRYRQEARDCSLEFKSDNVQVRLEKPQSATAGQSLVVYEDEICLGGGIIS